MELFIFVFYKMKSHNCLSSSIDHRGGSSAEMALQEALQVEVLHHSTLRRSKESLQLGIREDDGLSLRVLEVVGLDVSIDATSCLGTGKL